MAEKLATFKTYSQKAGETAHSWVLVDVAGLPLGRAAAFIATRLTGKYRATFTPHMDSGDYVVVVNADKLIFNGDETTKTYYRHSGFPGNLHETAAKNVSKSEMLTRAVKGMLPKNKLQSDRMTRLRVFAVETHDHAAQNPQKVEVK